MTESARLLLGERWSGWSANYADVGHHRGHVSLDVYRIEDVYDRLDGLAVLARWKRPSGFVAPRSGSTPMTAAAPSSDLFDADVNAVQVQGLMGHASQLTTAATTAGPSLPALPPGTTHFPYPTS